MENLVLSMNTNWLSDGGMQCRKQENVLFLDSFFNGHQSIVGKILILIDAV